MRHRSPGGSITRRGSHSPWELGVDPRLTLTRVLPATAVPPPWVVTPGVWHGPAQPGLKTRGPSTAKPRSVGACRYPTVSLSRKGDRVGHLGPFWSWTLRFKVPGGQGCGGHKKQTGAWECRSGDEIRQMASGPARSATRPGHAGQQQVHGAREAWLPSPVMMTSSPSSRNFLVCPFPSSMAFVPLHDSSSMEPKLSGSFITRREESLPCIYTLVRVSAAEWTCSKAEEPRAGMGAVPLKDPALVGPLHWALLALSGSRAVLGQCAQALSCPATAANPHAATPDTLPLGRDSRRPTGCGQDLAGSDWHVHHPKVSIP